MRSGCGTIVLIIAVAATLLPITCFSQAERATSQTKKPLIYQVGNVVRIDAEGPRSLLRALDALEKKYGWNVDYEEPQYPADLDLTTNLPSLPSRRHANVRNSRREGFSVEFNPAPANTGPAPDSRPDEDSVLTAVVDAYNQQ